jgi:hypothetical protein
MKRLSIFLILLFATITSKAQQAGQLYVSSFNDTVDIGYVCNGVTQNVVSISFGIVNLNQSVPLTIDSITYSGNPTSFQDLESDLFTSFTFTLTDVSYCSGPIFVPTRPGDDTLHITGYYNGKFTATANLVYHTRNSPDLAMFGYTPKVVDLGGGYGVGGIHEAEESDTLHDQMDFGTYVASSTPQSTGESNNQVELRSCGGATIDSIYESGNFSEFVFDPFPQLPYALPDDDSLVLRYLFTPQVIDTTGLDHHYLIFHSTAGQYLTWSFEYKVYPASSVSEVTNTGDEIKVFPNPATDEVQILGGQSGTIHLFDLMGRERMNANNDGTGTTLDVSRLESGIYFLRIGNQSTKVEIAR